MQNVQLLRKSTSCKYWSTGRLEKYWKPRETIVQIHV